MSRSCKAKACSTIHTGGKHFLERTSPVCHLQMVFSFLGESVRRVTFSERVSNSHSDLKIGVRCSCWAHLKLLESSNMSTSYMRKGNVTSPAIWFEPHAPANYNANSHTNYEHHLGRELCIRHASPCAQKVLMQKPWLWPFELIVDTTSTCPLLAGCWKCFCFLFNRPSYS